MLLSVPATSSCQILAFTLASDTCQRPAIFIVAQLGGEGFSLLQIIGVDGQPVGMKAINYFGFNNGATMFDGLYAGSNSLTQDFGLNLYRIQVKA